ncbi:hypothetical protein [Photobacterium damselae]|uniref:hypothetical protein n=1 Tax=Photobacterium damselae TaxID=38293 RepID=UPI001F1602FC|nr:hypothetical protein [Photobacterium damselae]UKA03554.1 hypothetical protein IHC89_19580 [Photobacterium damselae subsp. damselae]
MSKYQFFCMPDSNRKKFTYLDMGSNSFFDEKEQLLKQGFVIEDDYILAQTPQEAIEKFQSNFIYAAQEYSNAEPSVGLMNFFIELYKEFKGRRSR